MATSENSYGSVAEVAALVPRYTETGSFTASTRPTLTQVEKFIDRVSSVLNVLLAEEGFVVPVTQDDCKLALDDFAVMQASELAHAANGAGPYAPGNEELRHGRSPFVLILREAAEFIGKHADGFELLGATRTRSLTSGLSCRLLSDSGEDIHPMFSRKQFGNEVEDWDLA